MGITGVGSSYNFVYNTKTGKLSTKDGSKNEFTGMINSYSGSIVVFLLNTNIDKNSLQIYKNLGFFL